MQRYVVLLKFTDAGVREVNNSPTREKKFAAMAQKAGAEIESALWTLGAFDGVVQFKAPDEQTAASVVMSLSKQGNVRTQMLRAFDGDEFAEIVGKIPS